MYVDNKYILIQFGWKNNTTLECTFLKNTINN